MAPQTHLHGSLRRLSTSRLRMNVLSGFLAHGCNLLVLVAAYPVYLRLLGAERFGLWLVLSAVLTMAQLGDLGIPQAVMKNVAEAHGRSDIRRTECSTTVALMLVVVTGAIVIAVLYLLRNSITRAFGLEADNALIAARMIPLVGVLSVYTFIAHTVTGVLAGLGRIDLSNFLQTAGRIVTFVTSAGLLLIGLGLYGMLIGGLCGQCVIHGLGVVAIRRTVRMRLFLPASIRLKEARRLMHLASGIFGGSVVALLLDPLNKLLLSRYMGLDALPTYDVAFRGARQVRAIGEVGLRALMPAFSRLSGTTGTDRYQRIMAIRRKAERGVLLLGGPAYAVLLLGLAPLLRIWLRGHDMPGLNATARLMLIGTFVSLCAVPAYYMLMGLGKSGSIFLARFITAFCNAALLISFAMLSGSVKAETLGMSMALAWSVSALYTVGRADCFASNLSELPSQRMTSGVGQEKGEFRS